jgi:hypothetical protein
MSENEAATTPLLYTMEVTADLSSTDPDVGDPAHHGERRLMSDPSPRRSPRSWPPSPLRSSRRSKLRNHHPRRRLHRVGLGHGTSAIFTVSGSQSATHNPSRWVGWLH